MRSKRRLRPQFPHPRKLALPGDASSINAANIKKQADAHRLEMQRKRAKELAAGMNGLNVKVYAKCGENGRLFRLHRRGGNIRRP